jgi:hypothetical protein
MIIATRFFLVALMMAVVASCSVQRTDRVRCDVNDVGALFAAPIAFHGQRFCGQGYLDTGHGLAAIYPTPISSTSDRYDTAILLNAQNARRNQMELPLGTNILVLVRGRVDAESCNAVIDSESSCVPVRRAIILEDWEIQLIP